MPWFPFCVWSHAKRGWRKGRDNRRWVWKNVWCLFFWNILYVYGSEEVSGILLHHTYPWNHLWRFTWNICAYWLYALSGDGAELSHWWKSSVSVWAYNGCCIERPHSFFQDRTKDVLDFLRDISEYKTDNFAGALDPLRLHGADDLNPPKSLVIPDILCPWGCWEFSHQAKDFDPSLLIQQH